MGNVFASSAPPPPIQGQSFSNFVPQDDTLVKQSEDGPTSRLGNNPGSMEELHRKCKDVFPVPFDGTKVVLNKMLSNHFQIAHNIVMGSGVTPPGYRFGATYIGTKQMSPYEAFPIFYGEIDPSGNLNSRIIHLVGERIKLNLAAHFQNSKCVVSQFQSEYLGHNYTSSLTLGNIDPVRNSGLVVGSYLQNITNNLSLGVELLTQYSSSTVNSTISVAGRYHALNNTILSGTLNSTGVQLCYYQKKNEHLQVGVQVETNLTEPESVASFGYQIDLPKSNFTFKGFVDSSWNIGGVFEKKLLPLPFTFIVSGLINQVTSQTRVGVGLNIG